MRKIEKDDDHVDELDAKFSSIFPSALTQIVYSPMHFHFSQTNTSIFICVKLPAQQCVFVTFKVQVHQCFSVSFFNQMSFRCFCFCSSCSQPFPSESTSSPDPEPNAGQSHALGLRRHARAHVHVLSAHSTCHFGTHARNGSHGSRDARNGSWCRRWRGHKCGDSILNVNASTIDEHAHAGRGATRGNHQPLPFVRE